MPLVSLLQAGELEHIAEMQWRIGVPLATIILGIFAVPLSKTQPRAGRYGRLAIGLLVFIIYLNMLSAAKAWIEQGSISPLLGMWWVHGIVLLLALGCSAYKTLCTKGCCHERHLSQYMMRTILAMTALVLVVLLALAGLFEFIAELDDIQGDYQTPRVILYTLCGCRSWRLRCCRLPL